MPTRRPWGSGWSVSSCPASNSCARVSTRTTPADRKSASTATSRAPRPLLSATTGLLRPTTRAMRANLRGLPKPCRCMSTTSVAGSACQYCSRSLPETSARSPIETKVDSPARRRVASDRKVPASAPDWLNTPIRPDGGEPAAKVACSRTAGSALTMPIAFGPDEAHPAVAGDLDDLGQPGAALLAGVGEAAGHHDEPAHALLGAGAHGLEHLGRGQRHHGEVDVVGDVAHVGPRAYGQHVRSGRVDRVDRSGEAVREQRAEDLVPGRARLPGGPDDGHGRRSQQTGHRARLGAVLPRADDLDGGRCLLDGERELDVAVGHLAGDLEPGAAEDGEHPAVLRQHVGDEALHPALAGRRLHVLEQQRAEPAPLVGVLDDDRDLGVVGARVAGVAAHAHDLVAQDRDDRGALVVVHGREALDVARRQRADHGEEPVVDALRGQAPVERAQPLGVGGRDGTDVHRAAVGQHDVGLPVPGVGHGLAHAAILPAAGDDRRATGARAGVGLPGAGDNRGVQTPSALRRLDERVLGRAGRRRRDERPVDHDGDTRVVEVERRPAGDGGREVASVVLRVSRLVFVLLAAVVLLGIVFTALPTNADNVLVRNVLSVAEDATGPFRDVFTPSSADKRLYANYALAAGVYLVAGALLGRYADRLAARRTV